MTADKRRVKAGDVTVTILKIGELQFDLADALGVAPSQWGARDKEVFGKPLRMPVQCALIQTPETAVLVDAPAYDLEPDSIYRIPDYEPPASLADQLAAIGVVPTMIEYVVITHAHFDHFNGLTQPNTGGDIDLVFPNATVYMGAGDWHSDEMRRALAAGNSLEARTFGVADRLGRLATVGGKREIVAGVEIIPTPGETPGHLAVRVESAGQTVYCLGDLYHHEIEVERPEWAVTWADQQAIRASRAAIETAALRENALVFAAHIRGFGRIVSAGNGVRWQPV